MLDTQTELKIVGVHALINILCHNVSYKIKPFTKLQRLMKHCF